MKKIAVFPNKNYALIDTESNTSVLISGKEPIDYLEATDENMKKCFKHYEKTGNIKIG